MCFACPRGKDTAFAFWSRRLRLRGDDAAFDCEVRKALPLPCVSTALVANTLLLPCACFLRPRSYTQRGPQAFSRFISMEEGWRLPLLSELGALRDTTEVGFLTNSGLLWPGNFVSSSSVNLLCGPPNCFVAGGWEQREARLVHVVGGCTSRFSR